VTKTTVWTIGPEIVPTPQLFQFDYLDVGWGHGYGQGSTSQLMDEVRRGPDLTIEYVD
jgi:hypothetical protein